MTSKKRIAFQLPKSKLQSSRQGGINAQIRGAYMAESSTARVLANTPSLVSLYAFLKKPLP